MWCDITKGTNNDDISSVNLYNDILSEKLANTISTKNVGRFSQRISYLNNEFSFDTMIDEAYKELNKAFADDLIDYLLLNDDNDTYRENTFIPTAIVECNFAAINDVFAIIEEQIRRKKQSLIRVPCCGVTLSSIIDEVNSENSCVLLIEQVELSNADFLENLFRLLNWNITQGCAVSVIVCVSTDVSAFTSICSISTLNRVNAQTFQLPSSLVVFETVLKAILFDEGSQHFRFWPSGELTCLLRNRFFASDHSVAEIKRILRFAFLQHSIKNLLGDEKNCAQFGDSIKKYWKCLNIVAEKIGLLKDRSSLYLIHELIQCEKKFWESSEGPENPFEKRYRNWCSQLRAAPEKLYSFGSVLLDFVDTEIGNELKTCMEKVKEGILKDEEEAKKGSHETQESTKNVKVSFADFKKKMESQRSKANHQQLAVSNFLICVKKALSSSLRNWSEFNYSEMFLIRIDENLKLLHGDIAQQTELSLIEQLPDGNPLISLVYQKLQSRPHFKYVNLHQWGSSVAKELPRSLKDHADSVFFASIGQLEAMGIVRARADKKDDRINVIYHPTLYA